ncbi:hypothetical protein AADZ90_009030 [Aestuariibius sp. 2305UL40-4]|uniref:hypothetical protein n=1 Tax=Aestuariibius violaceus TaxID=3234132 RepID=UPI00345E5255
MTLRLISKDGTWFVFNQAALRSEAIRYFFNTGMQPPPSLQELYPRRPVDPSGIDIGDTHWGLARTAFAARPNLYSFIRPEAARQMAGLADTRDYSAAHPHWIPGNIWQQFLRAGAGVHRYGRASRLQTDIILINRDSISGYAEMPTQLAQVRRLLDVPDETLWDHVTGGSTEAARARWMAEANDGYNNYMWGAVSQRGMSAREASDSYRNEVYQRFLRAYLPLIGGSTAAHSAGGTAGDVLRAAGWI